MAATVTLNQALEIFGKLSSEDQTLMLEIAEKRRIDDWRKKTAVSGRKAIADSKAGKLKTYTADELIRRLHTQWNPADD